MAYQPSPPLPSGKAINWTISFSDTAVPTTSYSNTFPFTVLTYSPIPTNFAAPPGTVDLTKPGFRIKPYQTVEANPVGNSLAWTEEQLKGLHGPNIADQTGVDAEGYLAWTNVVNFDRDGPTGAGAGNFIPDELIPGQTTAGAYDNSALEVLTYLQLKAGVYRMVVNSDDGFKVSVGADPRDTSGLVLGQFDEPGGRAATDTLFIFIVQADGFYPFRLLWENGGGGASVEWFTQNVFGRKALVNSSTNGTLPIKAYRVGPSYPYVSRFSSNPYGFSLDYKDNGGIAINPTSVQVTLDGATVPASVSKTNGVTTIAYTSSTILPADSTHTIGLTYSDTSSPPVTRTRSIDFTVGSYVTLPASYAAGAPGTNQPGFKIRVNQIDAGGTTVEPNTIAFAEQQLAGMVTNTATGQPYTNSATANTNGTFVYDVPTVINFDATGTGNNGNFTPDEQMPGFPGAGPTGGSDNAAAEILAYVTLPAGLITMGVNSDDGFRLSPATSVSDPKNALTLGIFDGGRGAADTVFDVFVQQAGTYPMRLVWENGNGGANVEWFSVLPDGTKVLINDTTNAVAFKAYRAAAAAQPEIRITSARISGGNIIIQWTGGGTLESVPSLGAPGSTLTWTSTGNSSGSFTEPATGTSKFYRVRR